MDPSKFTENATGQVVTIGGGEYAFIPNPLPPRWEFPVRLWPLLAEVKQQLGELEGLGSVLPNPTVLLRPLSDREAIGSSALEGTYATPRELLLFELEPKEATTTHDKKNEHREVWNYKQALTHGTTSGLPLSNRFVRELHAILLDGVRGRDRTPGEFRTIQVAIGATRRFVPPPPQAVVPCMSPLEAYFHDESGMYDPIVHSFLVHYQFETIHPFIDGNGRVGRLLLAIMLQQRCGLSKPWLYMSEFFEQNRDEYTERLFAVSAVGAWTEWVEFCLTGALAQARATITRCRHLLELQETFRQRAADAGGSVRLMQIVDMVFDSPFIQVASLARNLGVTYPTAKSDIDRLVQAGILSELPNINPRTFYSKDVFRVAYDALGGAESTT